MVISMVCVEFEVITEKYCVSVKKQISTGTGISVVDLLMFLVTWSKVKFPLF